MFLGHLALAIAAKRAAPRQSLGTLSFAALFADLLWPTLLLAGVERARIDATATPVPLLFEFYPYSHSLLALVLWGALIGAAVFMSTRDRAGALVVAALVASHWVLDLIVHRPDLPLAPGAGALFGLSLWSSNAATMLLELALFATALLLYFRLRPEQLRRASLWFFVAFLITIHLGERLGGGAPPSVQAVAWVGQAQWLLVALAWWADRASRVTPAAPA